MKKVISRRNFLKKAGLASAGLTFGALGFGSRSYARILGANDRANLAFIGVGARGAANARTFTRVPGVHVAYLCDPDRRSTDKCMQRLASMVEERPKVVTDFRRVLDDPDLDGVVIATPDHWHTPAALLAARAGKHVYVEKPVSHTPAEGEMLVQAAEKYGVKIQAGTQRRSFPFLQQVMQMIHEGAIGEITLGKGWYANNRKATSLRPAAVPEELDFDLWQGPAPRRPYVEGIIPYDWHWFWNWGTGEALNNGTHELDLLLWGTGAGFPSKVTSVGGRYFYKDDWETPDTQIITWETPNMSFLWEGRSANNTAVEGEGRGVIFYGTGGSIETGNLFYRQYDLAGKLVREENVSDEVVPGKKRPSPNTKFDILHMTNFVEAIRGRQQLACPAAVGHRSNVWVQLGNIAQRTGHTLVCDPENGHILGYPAAEALWSRDYEPGWEPRI